MSTRGFVLTVFLAITIVYGSDLVDKPELDKILEDEISQKLAVDLLQSIERKYQYDLERTVDSVLVKIKSLLQNGTTRIQERVLHLSRMLEDMKNHNEADANSCLEEHQNETVALAEKALHQMVICGYALIGHDPAQAIRHVVQLKAMISEGLRPLQDYQGDIKKMMKICGHDHDTLKDTLKCVIAQTPQLKTTMMEVTTRVTDGVVQLTKQMAHGAMHEACLIEVVNTIEEEALVLMQRVQNCTFRNATEFEYKMHQYLTEDNATVLNVEPRLEAAEDDKLNDKDNIENLLQKVLTDGSDNQDIKNKIYEIQRLPKS